MKAIDLNVHVEIGLTPQLHEILSSLVKGSLVFNIDADQQAPEKKEPPVDFPLKDIPTVENQVQQLADAVDRNPAIATLLKDMKCELLPGNSAEVVRQAMANCRERICGKGYDKTSPFFKELTGEFKRLSALLGSNKPSELDVEKVPAFVLAISQLEVKDGKLVTNEAPF